MKASLKWLQTYVDSPLPSAEELAALLTEHVFEVEGVEKVGDDTVFDFKVLPDRAHYLLSHRGLANEIGVISKLSVLKPTPEDIAQKSESTTAVQIENEDFCRRFVVRRFDNVTGTTPPWMQERLEAIGQKSINLLVDISNYVMFDIGQPSHMLDADKVQGALVIRSAQEGEIIEILGGKVIELKSTDVVIADDLGPLEVAGVKGGERAGITAETKNIIVHAGNYDPTMIRVTATRLNQRTDASKRFENEITPELAAEGIAHISEIITDLCETALPGPVGDTYLTKPVQRTITVTASEVTRMLGIEVQAAEISDVMSRMNCVVAVEGETIRITPPSERFDLVIPEDIADEIGRIRGYNSFPGTLPPAFEHAQLQDPLFYYGEKVKTALVAMGYSEVLLYTFGAAGSLEIAKPLAEDKAWLRQNLSSRMADKLVTNRRNADLLELDVIKLAEVGQVFNSAGERSALALGVTLTKKQKGVTAQSILEADLEALGEALGVRASASVQSDDYGAVAEVDFTALIATFPAPGALSELGFVRLSGEKVYKKIIPYPFIVRDIAVFVPEGTSAEDVHALIREHAGVLRVTSKLFDEFSKEGKVSYAFRIVFQSPERTLEDKEVNEIMEGVNAAITAKNWEVR